jgi:hypothetical protein
MILQKLDSTETAVEHSLAGTGHANARAVEVYSLTSKSTCLQWLLFFLMICMFTMVVLLIRITWGPGTHGTEVLLPRHCLLSFQQIMNDAGASSACLNCCENILDSGYRLSCVNIPFRSFHSCIELSVLFTSVQFVPCVRLLSRNNMATLLMEPFLSFSNNLGLARSCFFRLTLYISLIVMAEPLKGSRATKQVLISKGELLITGNTNQYM